MLQEVHPDAVPLAEITIEESSLGLARYVVPVHAAPHRCAEGVGGVAFTTDDHEACGDVVRDGPGEQVTAGEDAAAEEDCDVHAATGGFGDRVAAEHADIAHGAEADEGVQVCGDIRFDHRPEGSCGYPAAGPHRRWPPAVCRRRSSDGGPSQAEPQFCCSGKSARPARATAYVTNVGGRPRHRRVEVGLVPIRGCARRGPGPGAAAIAARACATPTPVRPACWPPLR